MAKANNTKTNLNTRAIGSISGDLKQWEAFGLKRAELVKEIFTKIKALKEYIAGLTSDKKTADTLFIEHGVAIYKDLVANKIPEQRASEICRQFGIHQRKGGAKGFKPEDPDAFHSYLVETYDNILASPYGKHAGSVISRLQKHHQKLASAKKKK